MYNPVTGYDGRKPEPPYNTDPRPTTYKEWEDLEADRDRLQAELENAQREVRRAWKRAADLWDGYNALKDFINKEGEEARDWNCTDLADEFAERVIEARQNLEKHPRPREDQLLWQPR